MINPRFAEAVNYMVRHDAGGNIALAVTRAIGSGALSYLLQGLIIETVRIEGGIRQHYGGSVKTGSGLILHSSYFGGEGVVRPPDNVSISQLLEVSKAAAGARTEARSIPARPCGVRSRPTGKWTQAT